MFKKLRARRRRERLWELAKEKHPELTREQFDAAVLRAYVETVIESRVKN